MRMIAWLAKSHVFHSAVESIWSTSSQILRPEKSLEAVDICSINNSSAGSKCFVDSIEHRAASRLMRGRKLCLSVLLKIQLAFAKDVVMAVPTFSAFLGSRDRPPRSHPHRYPESLSGC